MYVTFLNYYLLYTPMYFNYVWISRIYPVYSSYGCRQRPTFYWYIYIHTSSIISTCAWKDKNPFPRKKKQIIIIIIQKYYYYYSKLLLLLLLLFKNIIIIIMDNNNYLRCGYVWLLGGRTHTLACSAGAHPSPPQSIHQLLYKGGGR